MNNRFKIQDICYLLGKKPGDQKVENINLITIKIHLTFQSIFTQISFFFMELLKDLQGYRQVSEQLPSNKLYFQKANFNSDFSESICIKKMGTHSSCTCTYTHTYKPQRMKKEYQNCSDLVTSQLT